MRKEFVVSMTPRDRNEIMDIIKQTKQILEERAESLDGDDRHEMWAKIRAFNEVSRVFDDN